MQGWAALALAGVTEESGVGMLLTTDEEIGSHASRALISSASAAADAVLVLEPSVDGALKTARKGTSWYAIDLAGRAAHAGLDPERGINALLAASELALVATAVGGRGCRHHGHADHPARGHDVEHRSRARAPHARRAGLDRARSRCASTEPCAAGSPRGCRWP